MVEWKAIRANVCKASPIRPHYSSIFHAMLRDPVRILKLLKGTEIHIFKILYYNLTWGFQTF